MNKTIAIVVNYNNYKDSKDVIQDLKKQKEMLYKIILVDNCSKDDSYFLLKKEFEFDKDTVILKSDKNGGFSYGNNFGIKYAFENFNFDFFLIINNDTVSDKLMNKKFIDYYNKNNEKKLGILTGKIYYFYNTQLIWSAGGYFTKYNALGRHYGMNELDNGENYNQEKELGFATACLWFFHKSLIKEIGYLPEEYFMYVEDVDYCLNIIDKGKKIIYLPEVKIWHKIGGSSEIYGKIENYKLLNRNRKILAKKYFSKKEYVIFINFMYIRSILKFLKHIIKDKKIINTFGGLYE